MWNPQVSFVWYCFVYRENHKLRGHMALKPCLSMADEMHPGSRYVITNSFPSSPSSDH